MINLTAKLSERENQIAETVGFGKSQKEAADILKVSIKTIDNTIQKVYKKANISIVQELTLFCVCRKFNIPLSMCEPARRVISIALLLIFFYGEFNHTSDVYRNNRSNRRIETVSSRRKD